MSRGKRKYFFVAQSTKECGDWRGAWAPSGFQQDVAHITQIDQAVPDTTYMRTRTHTCVHTDTHVHAHTCMRAYTPAVVWHVTYIHLPLGA